MWRLYEYVNIMVISTSSFYNTIYFNMYTILKIYTITYKLHFPTLISTFMFINVLVIITVVKNNTCILMDN